MENQPCPYTKKKQKQNKVIQKLVRLWRFPEDEEYYHL